METPPGYGLSAESATTSRSIGPMSTPPARLQEEAAEHLVHVSEIVFYGPALHHLCPAGILGLPRLICHLIWKLAHSAFGEFWPAIRTLFGPLLTVAPQLRGG